MITGDSKAPQRSAHEGVGLHPVRLAALLTLVYLALCTAYILFSSRLAAAGSRTVAELERLETVKGLVFVLSCSGLLFLLTWILLRRIARAQEELWAHRQALVLAERRALAGVLASSLAHDMNNILTVGVATADLLQRQRQLPADQQDMIRDLAETFERLTAITRRLASLGRDGLTADLAPGDLCAVVREELGFALRHARLRRRRINLRADAPIPMMLNATLLQQMLMNLLLNAADAAGDGGTIEVRVRREGEMAAMEVHDSGPGIPESERDRVFDAFYSTKPSGGGLGLLSVKAAVQTHRGQVAIQTSPLGGACFRIELPAQPVAGASARGCRS